MAGESTRMRLANSLALARTWKQPRAEVVDDRVVLRPRRGARVHLGCGDVRLPGYVNVDLPPSEGVASGTSRPDVEADLWNVRSPHGLLGEVRIHHVFEHFERAEALALLVRWHDWLDDGGTLTVETPDFEGCVDGFVDRPLAEQTVILRHVFGSQEAPWARHMDGWSEPRFRAVLPAVGFEVRNVDYNFSDPETRLLPNVVVTASKQPLPRERRLDAARDILRLSMNGDNPTERGLLARWIGRFDELVSDA
jgi:hypothetical protein